MNPAMFFVAALALCALPSALGLMCYKCQANETMFCNDASKFTMENCTGENNTCSKTAIMNPLLTVYHLGCVKYPSTCDGKNTTVCTGAALKNMTITSCMTTCCNDTDNCNKPPKPTTTTMPPSTTASTDNKIDKPTGAGDMFRPIGSLFIVLPAFYFGIQ